MLPSGGQPDLGILDFLMPLIEEKLREIEAEKIEPKKSGVAHLVDSRPTTQ